LLALEERYKLMEARVSSSAVRVSDITFQSFDDCKLWVSTNLPGRAFTYIYDAMALLSRVADPFVEDADFLQTMHFATKSNLSDHGEAKILTSFVSELPAVFGKVKAGQESTFPLPAVKSFKAWNPQDGVTGVRKRIDESLMTQVQSIQSGIASVCTSNMAAQALCSTLLQGSFNFLIALHNFIDTFYFELRSGEGTGDADAWFFTASIYRTILTTLFKSRLIGQQAASTNDPVLKCSLILYGTCQSYVKQQEYVASEFRHHPTLWPVLNMHLIKSKASPGCPCSLIASYTAWQHVWAPLRRSSTMYPRLG